MRLMFLAFLVTGGQLFAQSPSDSVRQVVADFFFAMKLSDSTGLRATLSPSVHFEATQTRPDSEPGLIQESVTNFLAAVARTPAGALDERIQFETIKVDGSIASVWTPYEFYYNGRYSHCGVNSFQLVRLNGKWQIQYLIDTRRKSCQPKSTSN